MQTHTLNSLCLLRIMTPQALQLHHPKEYLPGQARKEVLKWQPLCIFYEVCLHTFAKLSLHCFKVPCCFPQLTRKFHSFLSPLLPACPCALGTSTSSQPSFYSALLLYCLSQTCLPPLMSLHCQLPIATSAPAPSTPDRQENKILSGPCLAQKEGACSRPQGTCTLSSPCLYPNSVPAPN